MTLILKIPEKSTHFNRKVSSTFASRKSAMIEAEILQASFARRIRALLNPSGRGGSGGEAAART
jgi:hypothetical protein